MTIYSKFKVLMKAKAEEPLRELVARNDIAIFEQEIRDAQSLIQKSKLHLASVRADLKLLETSLEDQQAEITRRENQTLEAMETAPKLALDLAEMIAEQESTQQATIERHDKLKRVEARITKELKEAIRTIKNHQQQVVLLKANERFNQASRTNSAYGHSLGVTTYITDLNDSLQTIQQRQQSQAILNDELMGLEKSLNSNDIDERVKSAGIDSGHHNASKVLERLKARTNKNTE